MKKVNNLFALIAVSGILLFSSCAKEDDTIPDDPTTDEQVKFKGSWTVSESSIDNGKSTYNVVITDSTNAAYLQIAYLYGLNKKKTHFTVNGNTMTIPEQLNSGLFLKGFGTMENTKRISLKYTVQITKSHYDTVTAVLTK
jgi:hypothetical protein